MTDTPASSSASGTSNPSAVSFPTFVLSLVHAAATHFGDIADQHTGRPGPVNLPAAQQIIDILAVLSEKTRGNLDPAENALLENALYDLRMRYVDRARHR